MELKQALNILNLNENYTEEQLKKTYRSLIIKYHPDKHPENKKLYAEAKTKEINEAKDILERNLKKNTDNYTKYNKPNNYTKNENQEFINLLKIYKNKIIQEFNTIKNIDLNDKLFIQNKSNLLNILNKILTIIQSVNNLNDLKKEYQNYRKKYNEALVNYYIEFSKSTNIDTDMWTIHYYDTLKEIRDVMIKSINYKLQEELQKYSNHKYYKNILPLLNKEKEKQILSCLYGYGTIEAINKSFNDKIVLEFKKYEKRRKQLDELKTDPTISSTYIILSLEGNILKEDNFYQIYSQISTFTKIKCKIKKRILRK